MRNVWSGQNEALRDRGAPADGLGFLVPHRRVHRDGISSVGNRYGHTYDVGRDSYCVIGSEQIMKRETARIGTIGIGVVVAGVLFGVATGDWHSAGAVAAILCMGLAAAWFAVVQ